MPLIDKPLDSITEQDLLALISNQIREDKRIEFKAVIPGNSDRQRKEFLADVSSFANASGGDLIFGMEALGGVASRLVGLELASLDADILRLESILQDGLDPRIPNTKIQGISLTVGAALNRSSSAELDAASSSKVRWYLTILLSQFRREI